MMNLQQIRNRVLDCAFSGDPNQRLFSLAADGSTGIYPGGLDEYPAITATEIQENIVCRYIRKLPRCYRYL